MDKITKKFNKINLTSMNISNKRLLQFINLFKAKTGVTLAEPEALARAETLLRTIAILYQPVTISDYSHALAKKMFLKTKKLKLIN
jgi:hypothetical protein